MAIEGSQNIRRQRFEKRARDLELPLGEPNPPLGLAAGWHRTDLGDRDIPFAQKDWLASGEFSQVTREVRFRLMNIELNHGLLIA